MRKPKERYVVDVSDLINWQGHLSGIQRVVAEMAYRYEKEDAVFCYYEEATAQFYPLDSFSGHMSRRQEELVAGPAAPRPHSVAEKTKGHLKRVGRLVAPPIAAKVAKYVRHEVRAVLSSPEKDRREKFQFQDDDVLLVFGGHWDKPRYTSTLTAIRRHRKLRIAHLIHDLIPIYDKGHVSQDEHVRFPKYITEITKLSDVVYITSEAARRDYDRYLKETKADTRPLVHRVTLGEDFSSKGAIKPMSFASSSYILAVGSFEVRKNYGLLYQTYKLAHERGVSLPTLVIVGRQGWLSGDTHYQMEYDPDVAKQIILMHNVSDGELEWLYKHCLYTVQPSFSEGWGLPVAEAAYYKKVSAVANTSSLPEVVGDSAVYFSPYSTDECLAALRELLNEKLRSKLENKISKRTPASWDTTFQQTKEAL
jgi:glycosyltransferase involved in cell wall biosynthesis